MTQHYLLCTDVASMPRWRAAFHGGIAGTLLPDSFASDAIVWISTRLEGWRELVERVTRQDGVRAVVLSVQPGQEEGLQALEAGARGYCHLFATTAMLREVAVVVLHGGLWVGPELMARAIRATAPRLSIDEASVDTGLDCLSARERDVAFAVARGLTNKEVAVALDITERTVKAHLSAIFEKLAVRDRMQLVLMLSSRTESAAT